MKHFETISRPTWGQDMTSVINEEIAKFMFDYVGEKNIELLETQLKFEDEEEFDSIQEEFEDYE